MRAAVLAGLLVLGACEDRPPHGDAAAGPFDLALRAPDGAACADRCPVARGLVAGCGHRFAYGTNWAWHHFGADFGGIAAWGQPGAAAAHDELLARLARMRADGVRVVRWWLFPRFFSDGLSFESTGSPTGIRGTLLADVEAALRLAAEADVHLLLTWFSFDGFAPTTIEAGLLVPGLRPIAIDPARTRALVDHVVAPIAEAVERSAHGDRLLAWDLINEPEWAMSGASLYGDPPFEAQDGLETVNHAQMEGFLHVLADALRARSRAPITVGSAAIKWARAWTGLGLDFYQLHYYGWVYEAFPLDEVTPDVAGIGDRPVVMGELPMTGLAAIPARGLPARSLPDLMEDLYTAGYAGALSWAFNDAAFPWDGPAMSAFREAHPCQTELASGGAASPAGLDDARAAARTLRPATRSGDERQLARMHALVHLGRIGAARDEAGRFFARWPDSALVGEVSYLTGRSPRPPVGPRR